MPTDTPTTDDERVLMRKSLRGVLDEQWPPCDAPSSANDPASIRAIWTQLAALGIAELGADPAAGGFRDALLVSEELGRAGCPAPMLDTLVANIAMQSQQSEQADFGGLLESIHRGDAMVSAAFGEFDGDPNAGSAHINASRVNGTVSFVELGPTSTHLLTAISGNHGLAIVALSEPGVQMTETPGLAQPSLTAITLQDVPVLLELAASPTLIADLDLLARLCLTSRALGAAQRAFDLVVDHAKTRNQFGQPIGKFQAVQHKLTNCAISLDGTRLTLDHAASLYDRGSAEWRVFASAACAFASTALRRASLETHHVFGAIGYSEEHEAPRHFRRVHSDLVRHGGVRRAREELAAYLLDRPTTTRRSDDDDPARL